MTWTRNSGDAVTAYRVTYVDPGNEASVLTVQVDAYDKRDAVRRAAEVAATGPSQRVFIVKEIVEVSD